MYNLTLLFGILPQFATLVLEDDWVNALITSFTVDLAFDQLTLAPYSIVMPPFAPAPIPYDNPTAADMEAVSSFETLVPLEASAPSVISLWHSLLDEHISCQYDLIFGLVVAIASTGKCDSLHYY
jgi:hypothetical protein